MVKQVSSKIIANSILPQANNLTVTNSNTSAVAAVEPIATVNPLYTNINNNYGIQANNVYISGLPTTNQVSLNSTGDFLVTSIPYGEQEYINIGAYPNDGTGDPLRLAFQKINNNFSNLFSATFVATESVTVGNAANQIILEYPVSDFLQGTFQIRSSNPNNTDMQNITLSSSINNSGTDVKFTGYATTFDGNALCTYDMDVFAGDVRILISPLVSANLVHFISYQVTNPSVVQSAALELDGYSSGSVLGTETEEIIIVEDI